MPDLESYLTKRAPGFPEAQTRRELAYARIKDAIQNAQLRPGEPLPEIRLSKLLGISRTPVREALQQLVQEGLAESTPGHAVTVATRTVQDLLDVVHIRSLLEPEQVRLATEAMDADQLEALEQTMQRLERAAADHDLATWAEVDVTFHELLRDACPNKLLGETVVQLKTRVHHMANIDTHTDPERLSACTREHRAVVDAMSARNGQEAKAAMERHIAELTTSLLRRISYR